MSHKTFALSPSIDLVRVTNGGRTLELPPSDVPVEFDVLANEEERSLFIAMLYQQGMGEPASWVRMDRVDISVGVHSNRLLGIRIQLPEIGREHFHRVAQELRSALSKALRMLRERTPAEGARMNYRIVEEGLVGHPAPVSDEETPTLPWMRFALEKLRGEGPSSGPSSGPDRP